MIRGETSGKLVAVYKTLGDKVTAGDIIAIFENSAERASLLQAEGSYDAAKAGRDIAGISGGNTNSSLAETRNGALNTISLTLNSLEDAIAVKTDISFTDPKTNDCKLKITVPDSSLIYSIETQRKNIEKILLQREVTNNALTTESDLLSELTKEETEAQTIKSYLDDLSQAYAKAIPSASFNQASIDSGKGLVSSARSEVTSAISSLQGARTALNNSIAAKNIADKTSGEGASVSSSDASVKQALGAYNAALSRYEKTVIRSPLSGTLNSFSIKTGDYITAFTQIGVVSNNGTLEVKANISEDDGQKVVIGMKATIKKTLISPMV